MYSWGYHLRVVTKFMTSWAIQCMHFLLDRAFQPPRTTFMGGSRTQNLFELGIVQVDDGWWLLGIIGDHSICMLGISAMIRCGNPYSPNYHKMKEVHCPRFNLGYCLTEWLNGPETKWRPWERKVKPFVQGLYVIFMGMVHDFQKGQPIWLLGTNMLARVVGWVSQIKVFGIHGLWMGRSEIFRNSPATLHGWFTPSYEWDNPT